VCRGKVTSYIGATTAGGKGPPAEQSSVGCVRFEALTPFLVWRLDEGGFAHYYAYGSEGVTRNTAPLIVDSGLRALRHGGSPYPGMSS
jgi:hypothetical protein